jgi:hypothetical protein
MRPIERTRAFFAQHGRDIDKARFAYHFADLPLDDLLATLARYQNNDGGFGNGLEPDIAAPDSNPFATELALSICLAADVPRDHPLLARTVGYLEASQSADGDWQFSPAIYQHALAPWFQGWQFPALNPACTIGGLLHELGLGSNELHAKVEALFQQQAKPADLAGDDFYAARPYAYYLLPRGEHPQRELYLAGLLWWVVRGCLANSFADAGHALAYVRSPHTYTGRLLPSALLNEQLDRMLGEQQEDGGWPSPYAEHWRGPITVENLLTLRAFGRL